MDAEKKKQIKETVAVLIHLDKTSLLLIQNGAELLKARQDLEVDEKKPS